MAKKFIIKSSVKAYFETEEARDHHVKEHLSIPFDAKNTLLDDGIVEYEDEDSDIIQMALIEEETK